MSHLIYSPLTGAEEHCLARIALDVRNLLRDWFAREGRLPLTVEQISVALVEAAHRQPWVCPQCGQGTYQKTATLAGPLVCGACYMKGPTP